MSASPESVIPGERPPDTTTPLEATLDTPQKATLEEANPTKNTASGRESPSSSQPNATNSNTPEGAAANVSATTHMQLHRASAPGPSLVQQMHNIGMDAIPKMVDENKPELKQDGLVPSANDTVQSNEPVIGADGTPKRPLILSKRFLKAKRKDGADQESQWSANIGEAAKRQFHAEKEQAAAASLAGTDKQTPPVGELPSSDFGFTEADFAADDEEAMKEYRAAKSTYLCKVREGKVTEADEIDFAVAESLEQQRQNRLASKRSYEQTIAEAEEQARSVEETPANPMFMPSRDGTEEPAYKPYQEDSRPVKRAKPGKLSKKNMLESGSIGLKDHKEKAKKSRPKKPRKTSEQKTARGRVSKAGSTKKPVADVAKKRNFGPGMGDLATLMGNDIVAIAQENEPLGPQPLFGPTKRRDQALKELIASLPAEQRKVASSDQQAVFQAARSFRSSRAIQPDNGLWKLRNGMTTSLKPHQLLGAGWMCDRENSAQRPFGGMLCDDMGLGKTIQTIACMVDRRPPQSAKHKTTLIVVPANLMTQWLDEIGKHTNKAFDRVLVYRSGNRPMTLDPVADLEACDAVITSYNEVSRSYPRCKPPAHLTTDAMKDAWWYEYYDKHRGTLHRMYFYRIVLDEAHYIKTHNSRQSLACRALAGQHRWCLTGTPIQNGLDEFYPYFSFLKVKNTGDQQTFVKNYCKKGSRVTMDRLKTILAQVMLRRTHRDKFMNRPILSLPKLQEKTTEVEFNKVERAIYTIVRNRFLSRINCLPGPLAKNHRNIFVLFLRLRQLVGHPLLIQTTLSTLLEADDLEQLWRLCTREQHTTQEASCQEMITTLRTQLKKVRARSNPAADSVMAETEDQEGSKGNAPNDPVSEQQHDSERRAEAERAGLVFRRYLQRLCTSGKWEEMNKVSTCKKCFEPAQEPMLLQPCGHLYCAECLNALLFDAAKQELTSAQCLECSTVWQSSEPLIGFEEASKHSKTSAEARLSPLDTTVKALDKEDVSWIHLGKDVLYSAKTLAAKTQIFEWLEEGPDVKIVVFVQFRPLVDIMAKICRLQGWEYLTLTGDQSFTSRDKSLDDFGKLAEKRILLASLKVGGLGLNLTMASRVLLLDLWWNEW